MIDTFHCSGNSSLFQTELVSLWIWEQIVIPPGLISSAGIWVDSNNDKYFLNHLNLMMLKCSRDSSVSILSYGLRSQRIVVRLQAWGSNYLMSKKSWLTLVSTMHAILLVPGKSSQGNVTGAWSWPLNLI
jgi:hypothetical protein